MMSFGVLVLSLVLSGYYLQGQLGSKADVKNFFDNVSIKANEIISQNFPKELVINVDKGMVTLNQKLPYCLLVDKENNQGIVFDNAENPNIKSFETQPKNFTCKPFVIVGKDYIVAKQEERETRIYEIPKEVTVELNQKMLLENKDKYLPVVVKQGNRLYEALPIILTIIILPWIMLANFWYSLVVYLLAKVFKLTTHSEINNRYWIALFFGSILSIVNTSLGYFGYPFISFPFAGSIIIGLSSIGYLNYISNPSVPAEPEHLPLTGRGKKKKSAN